MYKKFTNKIYTKRKDRKKVVQKVNILQFPVYQPIFTIEMYEHSALSGEIIYKITFHKTFFAVLQNFDIYAIIFF